jgi:hypothetical protein
VRRQCSKPASAALTNIAMSTLDGFTLPGDVSASARYWLNDNHRTVRHRQLETGRSLRQTHQVSVLRLTKTLSNTLTTRDRDPATFRFICR